jgi:hypothetical protein
MKRNLLILIIISSFFFSCVSQSEYDKVIIEKEALVQERDNLKQELEDIKFGAPNLLTDGIKFYNANDFSQSRQKFQMLLDKHPDMPQAKEAKKYLITIDEQELWDKASKSDDISFCKNYISNYPNGKYKKMAFSRLEELKKFNMQKSYDEALSKNTSYAWKSFLKDYPNHKEASSIKTKIIRLEVDEILGDSETGQMPSFDQFNTKHSSSSSVQITNNTGCELTVRYSGPDAEIVIIQSRGTKTVYLKSGSYKIAASACGENYAGTEELHGKYGSTFYITTSRF